MQQLKFGQLLKKEKNEIEWIIVFTLAMLSTVHTGLEQLFLFKQMSLDTVFLFALNAATLKWLWKLRIVILIAVMESWFDWVERLV